MKIYLATPVGDPTDIGIRTNAKRAYEILTKKGYDVYAPWMMKIPYAWDYPNKDWGLMVFTVDLQHLEECDIVVVLSYGRYSTTGTAWEQGYAYARNKKILVVEMNDSIQSIMIANGCNASVVGLTGLSNYDLDNFPYIKTETEQK